MKSNLKKIMTAAEIAAGTGLYLLEHSGNTRRKVREFLGDQMDDLRERAKDTYEATADRASDLSEGFRDDESNGSGWNVMRFVIGLGIRVGIGFLMAPAKGEDTRNKLSEKAQDFGNNVRQRFGSSDLRPTGTGD